MQNKRVTAPRRRMHLECVFSGLVQGVGFRVYVCTLARRLNVAGFVQNHSNSTVSVVAEGSKSVLQELVRELHQRFMISKSTLQWKQALQGFNSFEVRME